MTAIPGTIGIGGQFAPKDSADTYPITDEQWNKGGYRSVADGAARDAITTARRSEGMLVTTLDDGVTWKLNSAPWAGDDTDWVAFVAGDSNLVDKIASGSISGHRIVRDVDGTHVGLVDVTDATNADDVLGMAVGAAADQAAVTVRIGGEIVEPGWSWTPLEPVWVTSSGTLTQTPPTPGAAAFSLQVGYATTSTSMRIRIGIPILF